MGGYQRYETDQFECHVVSARQGRWPMKFGNKVPVGKAVTTRASNENIDNRQQTTDNERFR